MLNTTDTIREEVERMAERQESEFRGSIQTGLRTMREIQECIAELHKKIAVKEEQLAITRAALLAMSYEPITAASLGL